MRLVHTGFLISTIFITFGVINCLGQDAGYSQSFANQLWLNPGYAGNHISPRISLSFRDQWPGIQSNYITYSIQYDQPVDFMHGGIGFIAMNDIQGDGTLRTTNLAAIYSYHLQASDELFFNAGLQVGFIQRSLNSGSLVFPDMIDPVNGIQFSTREVIGSYARNNVDISFGTTGSYNDLIFGLAIHHLNQPQLSESAVPGGILKRRYSMHAGYNFYMGKYRDDPNALSITPHFIYESQGMSSRLIYGASGSSGPLLFGIRLRQEFIRGFDAIILLAGLSMNSWSIAYSYDLSVPGYGIKRNISGAHEVSFRWAFYYPDKKKRIRAIKCPAI